MSEMERQEIKVFKKKARRKETKSEKVKVECGNLRKRDRKK